MTSETITKEIPMTGTAHGAISNDYVFLTRRVRIPRAHILEVKPVHDGNGATVITHRGAMHVCEDYGALMFHLYGVDVSMHEGGAE